MSAPRHVVAVDGHELFLSQVGPRGGAAPGHRFLPDLIRPGRVFDLIVPLAQVTEGYRAMDERRAVKAHLEP
ncbi:alcohol dehydrogenase [Streptomyces collinus]|uniref:Alcohol dehydrogenase n=2 Tax=Streptomyces collinus TaxID=42684 RepID=S5VE93_STRC3|nr:alcohol dehydrogenase [Streptomyces collinus Tu 365]AGS73519.1 alcohol dehydrogenase [Streptomyces collinus Tu 365]